MKKIIAMVVVVMLAVGAQAAMVTGLGLPERATFGATHVLTLTYEDLAAGTATNILTYTNLMGFVKGDAVSCPLYVLDRAFGCAGDTNGWYGVSNVTVTVGDSASATTFLTSTEMGANSNVTTVWTKRGVGDVVTPTATAVTTMTVLYDTVTNTAGVITRVMTNATASTAVTVVAGTSGTKVYSAADYLAVKIQGNSGLVLSSNVFGQARIYLKKMPDKQ